MPLARFLLSGATALLAAGSTLPGLARAASPEDLPVEVLPWSDDPDAQPPGETTDLAGTAFAAGTDWWALACDRTCRLQPVKLAVANSTTVNLTYNGDTPGQHLRFVPAPPRGTLLLFHPLRPVFAKRPLKAGPVPSGAPAGDTPRVHSKDDRRDAREVLIDRPGEPPWLLAPTLLRPAKGDATRSAYDTSTWPLSLDLRVGRHHQSLGLISTCGDLAWRDYLRWAGDLDGDGRPDLVVQLELRFSTEIVLYLSSLAGPGQFVGEAGHSHLDAEGEC